MKTKISSAIVIIILFASYNDSNAQNANTSLSNLTSPTKVNVNLLPDINNKRSMGSSTKAWKDLYLDSALYFDSIRFISVKTGTGTGNTAVGLAALNTNTTGTNNTGVGFNTLMNNITGRSNTAFGSQAMSSAIASYNTAVGVYALSNSQGDNNTAIGYSSMIYNSTGSNNTATGYYAMHANIDGEDNTATGNQALSSNTSGVNNVATGSFALWQTTDGGGNTAVGTEALYTNNGSSNTAMGNHSLYNTTTGGSNTALGESAGSNVKTGSNNVFIGANANSGTTGALTNSAAIGYNVTVTTNNSFILGNTDVNRWGFGVDAGSRAIKVGTTSANGNGAYLTQGGVWTNTSARSKKEDFQQQNQSIILEKINRMPVTKWKYKGTENEYHYGPMADDFYRLFNVGDDSSISDMDKTGVLFLGMQQLIKLSKGLLAEDKTKDSTIQLLDNKVNDLEIRLAKLETMMSMQSLTANNLLQTVNTNAALFQNIPNPFNHTTAIHYTLPETFSSAQIVITDNSGKTLKQINISGVGKGSVNVDASALTSGAYNYSLIVDGKLIATKQMVLNK